MARTFNTPVQPMPADDRTLIEGLEPTVLMPAPGGQATVVTKRRSPPRAAAANAGVELQRLVAGINPLLGAIIGKPDFACGWSANSGLLNFASG